MGEQGETRCNHPKAEIGVDDEKEALRQYADKFGECRDGTEAGLERVDFLLFFLKYMCIYAHTHIHTHNIYIYIYI